LQFIRFYASTLSKNRNTSPNRYLETLRLLKFRIKVVVTLSKFCWPS